MGKCSRRRRVLQAQGCHAVKLLVLVALDILRTNRIQIGFSALHDVPFANLCLCEVCSGSDSDPALYCSPLSHPFTQSGW